MTRFRGGLLLLLARRLDKIPEEKFDLGTWWCGSAGCAIGHACRMPEFKKLGLRMYRRAGGPVIGRGVNMVDGFSAAAKVFGIAVSEAVYLFCSDSYLPRNDTPPTSVADRIREFVAEKREETKKAKKTV